MLVMSKYSNLKSIFFTGRLRVNGTFYGKAKKGQVFYEQIVLHDSLSVNPCKV